MGPYIIPAYWSVWINTVIFSLYQHLPEGTRKLRATTRRRRSLFCYLGNQHIFGFTNATETRSLILSVKAVHSSSPHQADKFHMYVTYCRNKPDSSLLIQQHGVGFFEVTIRNLLVLITSVIYYSSKNTHTRCSLSWFFKTTFWCVCRRSRGDTAWPTPSPLPSSNQCSESPNTSCCSR